MGKIKMMGLYRNKYRISTTRLKNWDYSNNAFYFVTICTQHKEHFFGDVVDGNMKLSDIGEVIKKYWQEIPEHFPFVKLNGFVVMPNHIHGIIIFNKPNSQHNVETPNLGVSVDTNTKGGNNKKWKPGTLGVIINQYKRICTITVRKINADFAWQPRFHDHIIRNDKSYNIISEYVINNPLKWQEDKYYNSEKISIGM